MVGWTERGDFICSYNRQPPDYPSLPGNVRKEAGGSPIKTCLPGGHMQMSSRKTDSLFMGLGVSSRSCHSGRHDFSECVLREDANF